MTAGLGGPQIGQMPLLEFSRKQLYLNKLLTDVQTRGRICGFNGSGEVVQDGGTAVDDFMVALNDFGNGVPKGQYAIGGCIAEVEVAATKTASFNKPQVVGTGGMTQDRAAEAANKVWGRALGTRDQTGNKVLQTNVAAGGLVLVYIKPWNVFT